MPLYMKRFFSRLHEIETGGDGSAGGGGGGGDNSSGASVSDAGSSPADSGSAANNEPKSMLEAIERGLSGDDGAADAGKTADDRARDEQGRFAKAAADKAAADAVADPSKAPAKPEATKPGEELSMPEGLTPKAQERFQALTSRLHESTARAQALESDLNSFRDVLKQTGGRPEDFAQAFDYISAVNRGDLQSALNLLDAQRRQISLAMGKPLPGADPLSDFPDLRQRVDSYQMDETAAIELARARKHQETINQQRVQQQSEQQQTNQERAVQAQALNEINQLNKEWAARDPDYAIKEEMIMKQIPIIASKFPPSMWAPQVRLLYDTVSAMPMQQQRQNSPPPLRSSGQSGGARTPSSMLDALNVGLGYGNG